MAMRPPDECERAWPGLGVSRKHFQKHLQGLASASDGPLHVTDLYLAYACQLGHAAALAAFERELIPRVSAYTARVDPRPAFVDDVLQAVRAHLFSPRDRSPAAIATYSGRAPLASWLRTITVRMARDVLARERKLTHLDTPMARDLRAREPDPELEFLKQQSREAFEVAFARSLDRVDDRGRTLLRLHFVEEMSMAAIGRMFHVHESTVARWLAHVRQVLIEQLASELGVQHSELQRLAALVQSRLGVHLSSHLAPRSGR
jgi:RNA polymerase sigma-70 factor, ECF subfamily